MIVKEQQPSQVTILPSLTGEGLGEGPLSVVSTIGFFDGVHRGHQCLIRQVKEEARRRGARSLLITFDRHPRAVFAPESVPPLLTTAEEKLALLRATGVDDIYILPFDREMASLTAREFMQQVLQDRLGVEALVIGYDHHFGRPQGEGFKEYQAYGQELGMDVVVAQELQGEHVSSSAIRRALEKGDVSTATHLLGRPYTWTGRVVHGHAVGRQLGFPTANLEALSSGKLLPANGVYAVECTVHSAEVYSAKVHSAGVNSAEVHSDTCNSERPESQQSLCTMHSSTMHLKKHSRQAILNIGCRPTIGNGNDTTVEVHLLDFEENIYGMTLTLSFIQRLRAEQRFNSEEALMQQLRCDKEEAAKILAQQVH